MNWLVNKLIEFLVLPESMENWLREFFGVEQVQSSKSYANLKKPFAEILRQMRRDEDEKKEEADRNYHETEQKPTVLLTTVMDSHLEFARQNIEPILKMVLSIYLKDEKGQVVTELSDRLVHELFGNIVYNPVAHWRYHIVSRLSWAYDYSISVYLHLDGTVFIFTRQTFKTSIYLKGWVQYVESEIIQILENCSYIDSSPPYEMDW